MTKKVLIVDDEEDIIHLMSRFLNRLGIDTASSTSGENALELYKKEKFDCVLLDVHLGGISGIDVLKILKQQNPNVKVIIITGSISGDNKKVVMDLGAIDYLQKPINLNTLKERILQYI